MGFKLVRIDVQEPTKIPLEVGAHTIGRGSFLGCNDHRVSRQHAALVVKDETVVLKSLHQNPCFYKKSDKNKSIVLSQGKWASLSNSDRFGLLPDTNWYELIYCNDKIQMDINPNQEENKMTLEATQTLSTCMDKNTTEMSNSENFDTQSYTLNVDDENEEELSNLNLEFEEPFDKSTEEQNESQSLLLGDNTEPGNLNTNTPPEDRSNTPSPDANQPNETHTDIQSTPDKRPLTPDLSPNAKRVKIEPGSLEKAESPKDTAEQLPSDMIVEPLSSTFTEPDMDVDTDADRATDTERAADPEIEPQSAASDVKQEPFSPDSKIDLKKEIKSLKDEKNDPGVANPGSSNDQPSSSNTDNAQSPNRPGRERCIYGAQCYRKNPQHKRDFSHPLDADYGAGAKGVCPYGAACLRVDPRHWAAHAHPHGMAAPQPAPRRPPQPAHDQPRNRQGIRVVQRRGQIFYINAHSVHFHDDHYELEDEDGDSVDYDYEF